MDVLPYGRQHITGEDLDAVGHTLASAFLTQGPAVECFEAALAEYCDVAHAVAMNSATSALHVACLALDVGPGDVVWTSPISFVASANCARYCGADVDFVDVEPDTGNLSVASLQAKLDAAVACGARLPKVVIPVHLAGQPCDMQDLARLADLHGFRIIEDASHAIGAQYRDAPVGNCTFSDITVFSFHPVKIITTAEGGVATTADATLHARMERLRTHGIDRSSSMQARHADEPWYYEQCELGFNYRMSDVHATLGTSQLHRLDSYVAHRHHLAQRYRDLLADRPLGLPGTDASSRSSLHLFAVQVGAGLALQQAADERLRLFRFLREQGIGVAVHYIPIHTQPYYRQLGFQSGSWPVAERYYAGTLSLPIFGSMSDAEQDRVIAALDKALVDCRAPVRQRAA